MGGIIRTHVLGYAAKPMRFMKTLQLEGLRGPEGETQETKKITLKSGLNNDRGPLLNAGSKMEA
jgi:hypothetical protein